MPIFGMDDLSEELLKEPQTIVVEKEKNAKGIRKLLTHIEKYAIIPNKTNEDYQDFYEIIISDIFDDLITNRNTLRRKKDGK